jgi:hypothetical protein
MITVYKSYYVSEQKTKKIDVFLLFKNEFQRKMKENKSLGINSLFKNILNKLWSYCMPNITDFIQYFLLHFYFRVQVPLKYPCEILYWLSREIFKTIITYKAILNNDRHCLSFLFIIKEQQVLIQLKGETRLTLRQRKLMFICYLKMNFKEKWREINYQEWIHYSRIY